MNRHLLAVSAVSALAIGLAGAASAAVPTDYPLLVNQPGLRVYGPANRARVACPTDIVSLPTNALASAKTAVAVAMPRFEAKLNLDGRDPQVSVVLAAQSGFKPIAGGCGTAIWRRTIVASVRLPRVAGASLSQNTFAVARVRGGWVLWAWITG